MLAFVCSDMRNRSENIRTVCRRTFDTVSMVYAAFTSLMIDIEILQVVVEIDGPRAQVSSEKCGVCCEDGGDIDMSLAAERNRKPGLPLMKMRNDGFCELMRHIL